MAEKLMMVALSPTMEEGVILEWNKKEGDAIVTGDVLCEVETDKASMEYESSQEGTLLKIVRQVGDSAAVGDTIGIIGAKGEDVSALLEELQTAAPAKAPEAAVAETSGSAEASGAQTVQTAAGSSRVKASPLAKKIASQRGIDLSQISGSGPGGRIVKEDVESAKPSAAGAVALQQRADKDIPLSNIRKVIARRLSESKFSAPHYYVKLSVDMGNMLAARSRINKTRQKNKIGVNAFLIKFAAEALKRHPQVNSSWQGDFIRQFGSIDIGLAVDRGNGLITPIVRDCGNLGIADIDAELKMLIEKAGENKLKPEEYSGATFTISNLGSFGIEEFTAIINPPGAAILAVGQTIQKPVCDEGGNVVVRPMMKLSLSSDHRVVDGAEAGRFMYDLKMIVEDPIHTLL